MEKLYNLIKEKGNWITEQAADYIQKYVELENIPIDEKSFELIDKDICELFSLATGSVDKKYSSNNHIEQFFVSFGMSQAGIYRLKASNPKIFLCLLKYYRQSYLDFSIQEGCVKQYESFIDKSFKMIEMGFVFEWNTSGEKESLKEFKEWESLRKKIKKGCFEIIENLEILLLVLNNRKEIIRSSRAWKNFFPELDGIKEKILPYIDEEISFFYFADKPEVTFKKPVKLHDREVCFKIRLMAFDRGNIAVIFSTCTDKREINNVLRYRLPVENLIVKISGLFININFADFDIEIKKSLEIIGEFAGVDRVYINLFSEDLRRVEHSYTWMRKGFFLSGSIDSSLDKLPWIMENLKNFRDVYIPKIKDIPPEGSVEKEFYQKGTMKSFLAIPIKFNGKLKGSLGFCTYPTEKIWKKEDTKFLRLLGEIFVNVWERREGEGKIAEYREHLESLVSERTKELLEANKKLKDEILYRQKAEDYLNYWLSMEELISNISTRFINLKTESPDRDIEHTLRAIGTFMGVDRAFLYLFSKNKITASYEWFYKEPKPPPLDSVVLNVFACNDFALKGAEEFNVSSVSSMEDLNEKSLWESHNVRSFIINPLYINDDFMGSVGFTAERGEKLWKKEEIRILKIVGEVFVKVLERSFLQKSSAGNAFVEKQKMKFHNIIGRSLPMQKLYSLIEDISDIESTVLITGESGTGKELVAEALHYKGTRRHKPLVKVNCSALSEHLLESELFGHVKGAFTGSISNKTGRFKKADGGTLFLDEIGDISEDIQKKLLRVLQEKEFEPVGSSTSVKSDVRIVVATNQNLLKKVERGEFRKDLYFRLEVIEIKLPLLRERKEDIPLLAEHFIRYFNKKFNRKVRFFSSEVMNLLCNYSWPGNVRELEHTVEYAVIFF